MISSLVWVPSRGHQPIKTARSTTVNRKTCIGRHSALIGQPRHSPYDGSTCRDLRVSVVSSCNLADSSKRAKLNSHNERLWNRHIRRPFPVAQKLAPQLSRARVPYLYGLLTNRRVCVPDESCGVGEHRCQKLAQGPALDWQKSYGPANPVKPARYFCELRPTWCNHCVSKRAYRSLRSGLPGRFA